MLIEEALWIKNQIEKHFNVDDFPLLNLGSSTKKFREIEQRHINDEIFNPLTKKDLKVIHTDIKQIDGVDIVGNINDAEFRKHIKSYNIQSILCSNLLEHVENPSQMVESIIEILPLNGKLIISTPFYFPFHKDPIDTLLRPTIEDLNILFKDLKNISSMTVISNDNLYKVFKSNPKYFFVMLTRWISPFYKFHEWKLYINDLVKLKKNFTANCIVFKKIT